MPPVEKRIANPQIFRLRALQMLQLIIGGLSQKEIARQFNVDIRVVKKSMDWLEKHGEFEKLEDKILKELYPLAAEAFRKKLTREAETGNDIEAAKEVMKMPLKAAAVRAASSGNSTIDELTLERYTFRRKLHGAKVVEGQVLAENNESPDGALLLDEAHEDERREGEGDHDAEREEP